MSDNKLIIHPREFNAIYGESSPVLINCDISREKDALVEKIRVQQSRIKELEDAVVDLYNSLRRLSLSGDGSHSSKRESFYDCLPTLQLEYSERDNFAREIITKHKDLIESITKE